MLCKWAQFRTLYLILCDTGSQCSSWSMGVMCAKHFGWVRTLAAKFWIYWSLTQQSQHPLLPSTSLPLPWNWQLIDLIVISCGCYISTRFHGSRSELCWWIGHGYTNMRIDMYSKQIWQNKSLVLISLSIRHDIFNHSQKYCLRTKLSAPSLFTSCSKQRLNESWCS